MGVQITSRRGSSVWSKSFVGHMIEAMIAGERDSVVLADIAKGSCQEDRPARRGAREQLRCSPRHRVPPDHRPPRLLGRLHRHPQYQICARLLPFEPQVTLLTSITGISVTTAEVIVAETGADMSRFRPPGTVCLAGVAPASYESAGKKRPAGTRKGAPWLRRTLIEAARAGARTKGSYDSALDARIPRRRGPNKAGVAVANSMLEPPGTYSALVPFTTQVPTTSSAVRIRPLRQSGSNGTEALGFTVTIEEKAA